MSERDTRGSGEDPSDRPPGAGSQKAGAPSAFDGDLSRSDLALVREALRNDWPIPPSTRERILERLIEHVDPDHPECQTLATGRYLAAHRTLQGYLKLSMDQQSLDLARQKFEGRKQDVTLAELVAAAEARAAARRQERDGSE